MDGGGATSGREPLRQPERDRHGSGEDGLLLEQPGNIVVVVGQVEPEAVGDNAVYAYCVDFIGQTSSGGRGGCRGRPVRQRWIDRREPWKRP